MTTEPLASVMTEVAAPSVATALAARLEPLEAAPEAAPEADPAAEEAAEEAPTPGGEVVPAVTAGYVVAAEVAPPAT